MSPRRKDNDPFLDLAREEQEWAARYEQHLIEEAEWDARYEQYLQRQAECEPDHVECAPDCVSAEALANAQRWVGWRLVWDRKRPDAPPRKIPYDPRTGRWARVPTDPQTYSNREAAEARKNALAVELLRECQHRNYKLPSPGAGCGIGLVLGQLDDGRYVVGIDLDSCRDASGVIAPWAEQMIERFNTYAEISPSGTGIKLFFILSAADMERLHALLGKDTHGKQLTRKTFAAGEHREVALDIARFYAWTDRRLKQAPNYFRQVPFTDVAWFINEAGPAYLAQQGGIPFMITQKMKATLRSAGYSDEQIAHMTPTQAHEIIRQRKGNGHAEEPFEQVARENNLYERDESPSGYGYRFMRARRREGMSFDEALAACLANEGKAGEWAKRVDERQHERAYERWDLYDEKKRKPTGEGWPEPKPLPHGLAPVAAFDTKFLPDALAPWVDDIAARLQCPPEYVGVSAITALGSLIGRRVGIKPQARTDWIEYANLWAAFIGQPGVLKSPAMLAALAPLHYLENEAAKDNEVQLEAYAKNLGAYKLRKQVAASLEKDALKKGKQAAIKFDLDDEPEEPKAIRYRTNDSTYEKLGELLLDNPTGLLLERDELCSLLQHLDREDQAQARSFFMTGWAGSHPYTFDRIIRGHIHIEAVCLSVLGNTQPTRISQYVCRANLDGGGGDGLIQRFGLLVWPDVSPEWDDVDQYPDSDARRKAWDVFERMGKLDEEALRKLGAHKGPYDKTYYFRFDQEARAEFLAWRRPFERRLRSGELSPALQGHFAKYRKLVPALALINHLADGGKETVGRAALRKALAFSVYLESHAQRIYGAADMVELAAGEAILLHIKAGDLTDGFTARDVHRHGWSNLTERDAVQAGLNLLVDCDYLAPITSQPDSQRGRPKITFAINPKGMK
jgi:putative DNA primase/helicase